MFDRLRYDLGQRLGDAAAFCPYAPNMRLQSCLLFLALPIVLLGCGDDDAPLDGAIDAQVMDGSFDAADGAIDTNPQPDAGPAPVCAAAADLVMYPTPLWEQSATLTPPLNDRATSLLSRRPLWAEQLALIDGWPRRPTVVLPLWRTAMTVEVDVTKFALFGDAGTSLSALSIPLSVQVDNEGVGLIVVAETPIPADVGRVVLALEPGAVVGATVLRACDGDGPHEAYENDRGRLDGVWDYALGFRLSNVHQELPALATALEATPALTVDVVAELDVASLADAEFAPSEAVLSAARSPIADGRLSLPAYQDSDGRFVVREGVPVAQGITAPGITVLLPAEGLAPFPWVLFQHGGSQHRHLALRATDALLEAGFAVVAIDLPGHGARAPGGEGTGGDLDILVFDDPLQTRDNLRQASADHLAVITGVVALNAALEPLFGAQTLSQDEIRYSGLSLGAITGSLTFASSRSVDAAALFVGGGGFQEILGEGFFRLLLSDVFGTTTLSQRSGWGLAEVFLNGADPLAYSVLDTERDRPMLFFEAIDDPLIPNASTERWAQSFGAALAVPFDHDVQGMETQTLPSSAAGLRLLIHAPLEAFTIPQRHAALIETDYAKEAAAHCLQTDLLTGACELTDTGWATR